MTLKRKSKYQNSQLITHEYLGCELGREFYRESNVLKINHLLCKSMKQNHAVYLFELLDSFNLQDLENLGDMLHELRKQKVYYVRMNFDHKIMLAIFTSKGLDYAVGMIDSISTDYTLVYQNQLNADDVDLEEVAFNLYQLGIHVPDTPLHKAKRFSSTNLECDDKILSLIFKKQGVIVAG